MQPMAPQPTDTPSNYWMQHDPTLGGGGAQPTSNQGGSWWEKLLPTAGSVVGGIGGGILGGLAAPFTGGLINPIDAGIAGAGLGGGLGKAGQNALTGQSVLQKSDLTQAALGAGGQALGFGAGSVLGKLGGAVFGKAAGKAATDTASDLVGQGGTNTAQAATRTGGVLPRLERDLFRGQFAKGTLSKSLGDSINTNYGISDATQIPDIANMITGSAQGGGAVLNKAVEKALMKTAPGVDVGDLYSEQLGSGIANDLVKGETSISPNAGNKILASVNKSVQSMMGGSQGMVGKQVADPLDVLQQSRVFSSAARAAADKAFGPGGVVTSPEQAGVYKVYSQLADELNQRVFTPNGAELALPDAIKADVLKGLAPVRDINPETYAKLADEVQNTNSISGLRSLQSKWVGINQAFNKTADMADMEPGMTTSEVARSLAPLTGAITMGPTGAVAGIVPAVLKSGTIDRGLANALNGVNQSASGGVLNTLGNVAKPAAGALGAGAAGLLNLTSPNGNDINLSPGLPGGTTSNGNGANPMDPSNNIFTSQSAQLEPIKMMLMAGMFDPNLMGQFAPGANDAFKKLQTVQNVASQVNGLYGPEGLYSQAGGAQGPIRGLLSELGARVTGGPAGGYATQAGQLQSALSQASGLPAGAISMPTLQQGKASAQTSLQNLQSLLTALGAGQST